MTADLVRQRVREPGGVMHACVQYGNATQVAYAQLCLPADCVRVATEKERSYNQARL